MRKFARVCATLVASLALVSSSAAQEMPGHRLVETAGVSRSPGGEEPQPTVLPGGVQPARDPAQLGHSRLELALTIGTLGFGALVLGMLGWFLGKGYLHAEAFLKLFVLVMVVTAGLFVVTAGYTQDQIAPMMGLLGTLVGYLLGREASRAAVAAAGKSSEPEL